MTSTGRLPFGLTPADLVLPHTSQPWNPLIAGAFYRRGIIDHWGRGTLKIIRVSEEAGLVYPELEVRGGEVVVRSYPAGHVPPSRVSHELTPPQQELLEMLATIGLEVPELSKEQLDLLQSRRRCSSVQL